MTRPDINEIYDVLKNNNSLIVHFSGCPKGMGKDQRDSLYPADLGCVLDGNASSGVSCSTVSPGDIFSGVHRNATGCVGVIISPRSGSSIVAACFEDCGSYINEIGNRATYRQDKIEKFDLVYSINNRQPGRYNEWVIKDFDVKGIFAVSPYEVTKLQVVPCQDLKYSSEAYVADSISIDAIRSDFPTHNIYSFINGNIVILRGDTFEPILFTDIYA